MTNLILSGAKTLGQHLVSSAGQIGLSYANRAISNAFDNRVFEGPRLDNLHISLSADGGPMARIYGKARIAGQVIWAARVREITTEQSRSGKGGGPTTRQYSYTLSFAVGLCQGEILGLDRIWVNGQPFALKNVNYRLYLGTETQDPDPLIAAIEDGPVPAFRGAAYIVFEDLPIDEFGARLPQFSFEITRLPKRSGTSPRLEDLITGVDLIPGSGEFVYGSEITEERLGPGTSKAVNMNTVNGRADMDVALDQLQTHLPKCTSVTLLVNWFGDDLRAGHCKIRAGVESRERILIPDAWQVGDELRNDAYLVSKFEDRPVYGGTPSDKTVVQAIENLKSRGFKVTLYPFILMDIGGENSLPSPYGGAAQAVFPWRGRITCDPAPNIAGTADKTSAADNQVNALFGAASAADFTIGEDNAVSYNGPAEQSYRRMVLHYAHLMQAAGGVDSFIIGSEMRGLTTVRGAGGGYPAVAALKTLAADVRSILGADTKLTYAADWSEYFGHHLQDGSHDVNFHLDPLWADSNIDAVGIDAYFPLADWRDEPDHLDGQIFKSIYDPDYLMSNIEGGEGYDWHYINAAARGEQTRAPITDGLASKPWVFRYKDIRSWWQNPHYNRQNGQEVGAPTAWIPKSKPFWFTEIGCPAIDKGANQPNVFRDPKSSESAAPYYSSGARDDLVQRSYLEAFLRYWGDSGNNPVSNVYAGKMVDMKRSHVWCWDARPYPDFPSRLDIWSDGGNWRTGHWVNGRTGLVSLADIVSEITHGAAGERPDVTRLSGMVSGFVLGRPMSARAALTPLSLAYGFDLSEQANGLSFASRNNHETFHINRDTLAVENGEVAIAITRVDANTRPKDIRLSFIDPGRDYQAGSVYARDLLAETARIIDVQVPLMLGPSQAKYIANSTLSRALGESASSEFAVPPANLALEAGDIVQIGSDERQWQITDIDGLGKRSMRARQLSPAVDAPLQNGSEPGISSLPDWVSAPDGFALDIADFSGGFRTGPLVGAILKPWAQCTMRGGGGEVILNSSVRIGALLTDFAAGPIGRIDYGASIDIYLPSGALSSLSNEDFLAGGNMLAAETAQGWEIFQFQNADLISANTYRLRGFLRGLYGSGAGAEQMISSGARIIDLGTGWENLPLSPSVRGSVIELNLGAEGRDNPQTLELEYIGEHLRPLSPVHARAARIGDNTEISWIRRTRIGGDDWASVDVPLGEAQEAYEIDIVDGGAVLATYFAQKPKFEIPTAGLEALYGGPNLSLELNIYQMSQTYGRGALGKFILEL